MKTKQFLAALAGIVVIASGISQAAASDCKTLLTTTCTGCHPNKKICKELGKDEKFWQSTMEYMITNGANLSSEDISTLVACLSSSDEVAKGICK